MTASTEQEPSDPLTSVLEVWLSSLSADRGARAELRRADSPDAAAFAPAYVRLRRAIDAAGIAVYRPEAVASFAALAAQVVKDDFSFSRNRELPPLSEAMAGARDGSTTPIVSELRFRRMVAASTVAELHPHLRRAIRLLDGRANLRDLARDLMGWSDRTRQRWAYSYFATSSRD